MFQTTQSELDAFYASALPGFLEYLKTHSTDIGDIEIASSLVGIKSLPSRYSLGGVEKNVLVPLSLLTKDVDIQIAACVAATQSANTAASAANTAAKKVTDAILDITTQKQAALDAAQAANTAASLANAAKAACDTATSNCNTVISNCNTKISESVSATSTCKSATQTCITETAKATAAANAADTAAANCNTVIQSCNSKIAEATSATQECKNATQECKNETANARIATAAANVAADKASSESSNLASLKNACQDVTTRCDATNSTAEEKIVEMAALMKNLSGESSASPVKLELEYPSEISTKNKLIQTIGFKLYPSYVMRNIMFQRVKGESIDVDPGGKIEINSIGETSFYVIPTGNTSLWKKATVNIRKPVIRLTSTGKFRMAGTKIRIN